MSCLLSIFKLPTVKKLEDYVDIIQVKQILEDALSLQEIHVKGEGSHYEVVAVDSSFEGISRVAIRSILVYSVRLVFAVIT